MQYPVERTSQFHCELCEEMDILCQRLCLCVITLDGISGSQESPMLSDRKEVRAVTGYSSLSISTFMPEPGCLNMGQTPVVLCTVQTQKASPVAEQHTSISTGLLIDTAPKVVRKSSAAKEALQKMGEASTQGHPVDSGVNLGTFLSTTLSCPHKEPTAILNNSYKEGSIKAGSLPVSPCPSSSWTLRHFSISQIMQFLSLQWVINIDIPINK